MRFGASGSPAQSGRFESELLMLTDERAGGEHAEVILPHIAKIRELERAVRYPSRRLFQTHPGLLALLRRQ